MVLELAARAGSRDLGVATAVLGDAAAGFDLFGWVLADVGFERGVVDEVAFLGEMEAGAAVLTGAGWERAGASDGRVLGSGGGGALRGFESGSLGLHFCGALHGVSWEDHWDARNALALLID